MGSIFIQHVSVLSPSPNLFLFAGKKYILLNSPTSIRGT